MYIEKNSCFIPQREEKMSEKTLAVLNDAAIRFDGRRLTMENNLVSRTIDFFRGYPETVSFRRIDLDREFADPEKPGCGVSFSGITPPGMYDVAFQLEGVTAKSVPAGWAETAHLEAEVTMYEPVQQVRFRVTYFLYPGVPAVGVRAAILSRVMPNLYWSYRREMRSANDFLSVEQSSGAVDGFRLAPGFAPECSLEPVARTDVHDDLLLDHPALPGEEFFRGNLLWCRNRAGAGVLVLQESSPSGERRDWAEFDFIVRDRRLRSCAWNAAPWELSPEVEIESGRSVTILAADEVERDCRLKDYLRGRFPTAPETHVAMVNPWGCGRFRELVGEEFLRRETGRIAVALSGPSHAEEVSRYLPTGCVAACEQVELAETVQDVFMNDDFRVYASCDAVGVELSAAMKNVIALCAGISDGLGLGDNSKALLVTRGLTELARLGIAMGGRMETFSGLAGVGDMIVTCTSMHSGIRRAGILIGEG